MNARYLLALGICTVSISAAAQHDSPYAQFGYKGRVLRTPQERRQQMLLISNTDTTALVASIGIEPRKGKYYLFDKKQHLLETDSLRPEQLARFLSVDPLTKDYSELTPYQFGSNTPIQAIDLDGLEAWQVTRQWEPTDIKNFANYAKSQIKKIISDKVSEDCANFALRLIVGYASQNGLPLSLRNSSQTFDMSSTKFKSTSQYLSTVKSNIQAADLPLNTYAIPQSETQSGDMEIMHISLNAGRKVNFNHVTVFENFNSLNPLRSTIAWGNLNTSTEGGVPVTHQNNNWVRDTGPGGYNDGTLNDIKVVTGSMNSRWNVLSPAALRPSLSEPQLNPIQPRLETGGNMTSPHPAQLSPSIPTKQE